MITGPNATESHTNAHRKVKLENYNKLLKSKCGWATRRIRSASGFEEGGWAAVIQLQPSPTGNHREAEQNSPGAMWGEGKSN